MECRICYESTPPLLTNVCKCKGSQGTIHLKCLRGWMAYKDTKTCEICITPFSIQPVYPFAWKFLSSSTLDMFLLLGVLYIPPIVYRYIHTVLISAYTYSYFPHIYNSLSLCYVKKWFYFMLIGNNRIEFPLITLINILLLIWNPIVILMCNPYRRAWYIHQMILATC